MRAHAGEPTLPLEGDAADPATTRPDFHRYLSPIAPQGGTGLAAHLRPEGWRRRSERLGQFAHENGTAENANRQGRRQSRCAGTAKTRRTAGGMKKAVAEGKRCVMNSVACWVAVAVSLLVSGCTAGSLSEAEQQTLAAAAVASPKLQPGDKIRVNVYGENTLSGEYEIDPSGQISLPLAGTIEAAGLTQAELEQALAKKFRSEYLKNPKVTVTIATLRPFYIMGEVTKPGEYSYKSGLNILTALAIAGGPTYRASRNTVQIQRRGESSMREYPISASVPVLPGDVIRVPERYF